jgi:hypothetical protein
MTKVRLRRRDAATVSRLLQEIGRGHGLPADLRHNARRWASTVDRTMDSSDLQRVAVLLRQASSERSLPADYRDAARYWTKDLLGRICPTAVPSSRQGETMDARRRHRLGAPIWILAVSIYWTSFRHSWREWRQRRSMQPSSSGQSTRRVAVVTALCLVGWVLAPRLLAWMP